ncbi:YtxH domain-containing protein [Thiocapsa rosea]|uniref:Uncharacterized protein n=1 Tax=Thiocapsa rosea TaxID=69360 RepID=A0A495V898_9GAMM|nr:YtxH domain-containing protein [Thiocapsa rosea]RKT44735.1 hypothetical protein BDD21_2134 [Thiocapsa rosea]
MSSSYHPSYGYPMAPGMGATAAQGQAAGQTAAGGQGPQMVGAPVYGSTNTGAGYGQGYGAVQAGYGYPQQQSSFLNFGNDRFLKGLLIGAAATYLLTNESVQRTAIKGVVQVWSALQSGIEEAKERFHDAEAELHHAAQSKTDAGKDAG